MLARKLLFALLASSASLLLSSAICMDRMASVISGRNLSFVCGKQDYTVRGGKRFNPIKYIYMFNLLETGIKKYSSDKYFDPEDRNE